MSNSTRCYAKTAPEESPPLFQHGDLIIQAHHVGWLVSGIFTIIATIASGWLIYKHLKWYTNKREQRYIVRLLLMVPIYATVSLLSYILWNQSTPLLLLRDAYESVVLTSFFFLLLVYLHPETEGQKEIFRNVKLEKWVFPLGWVRWKPKDGLFFLQLMKWGVLQYCFLRPTTTLAAVILDMVGLYCVDSWSPVWGHVYITIILSLSVTVAMYCLIQLYIPIAPLLKSRKPLLKLFAVKAVVFLTFWQATLLGGLSVLGVVKDTKYMTADEINIGFDAILETFEMTIFAFLHFKAFSYKPYKLSPSQAPQHKQYTPLKAFMHAMDPRETLVHLGDGAIYMWRVWRGREAEPALIRRRGDFEKAFEGEGSRARKRESWYTTRPVGDEEKQWNDRDRLIVSSLGEQIPRDRERRERGKRYAEDDDVWDVELDDSKELLTLQNLHAHDVLTGSALRRHSQRAYRPVSSLIPAYDLPEIEYDPATRVNLDDPPPGSMIAAYTQMRSPELRRMYAGSKTKTKTTANVERDNHPQPARESGRQKVKAPKMEQIPHPQGSSSRDPPPPRSAQRKPVTPQPVSASPPSPPPPQTPALLYPSPTLPLKVQGHNHGNVTINSRGSSYMDMDEFYDFDDVDVYEPTRHS